MKRTCLIASILLGGLSTEGFCDDCCPSVCCEEPIRPIVEIKLGYFFFSDDKMRKIYDDGGFDVQLSGSYPVWEWLNIYGSVEYLEKHGKSLNAHQKTSIWEVPLSLGLKPTFEILPDIQYYFTLGPRYIFLHAHNDSNYVDKTINHNGLGGFVNTGFNFIFWDDFVFDIFGEYSYKKMHVHTSKTNVYTRSIQVGGFVFGAGLGYAF